VGSPSRLIDKCLGPALGPSSSALWLSLSQPTGRALCLAMWYVPSRRRKDFQAADAHKEKLEEDYHLLHRRPTASPEN
jgi:hypothetical protein